MTHKDLNNNKTFARTEREQIREIFRERARSAPIPNPFDGESMRRWEEYCEEMRCLEAALRDEGEDF